MKQINLSLLSIVVLISMIICGMFSGNFNLPIEYTSQENYCEKISINQYTSKENASNDMKNISPLRIAIMPDIHYNGTEATATRLQALIDSINLQNSIEPFDFVISTGDIIGASSEYTANELMEMVRDDYISQLSCPFYPLPGNHDALPELEDWKKIWGNDRQFAKETDDFYFICADIFGDNYGKTWLSYYSMYYNADDMRYITCEATDDGALLVGRDIELSAAVENKMQGWSLKSGSYVKLARADESDMYSSPSLDWIKSEVEKAGDKKIIFVSHQMMDDSTGVKAYLNSLDNFAGFIEGHSHIYICNANSTTNQFTLNAGHFGGDLQTSWENNYNGWSIIETKATGVYETRIIPSQIYNGEEVEAFSLLPKKIVAFNNGILAAEGDIYQVNKPYKEIPISFEANIYIDSTKKSSGGTILGNASGANSTLSFSIYTNGVPRLYYVNNGKATDIQFDECDIRSSNGNWRHLAIVIDSINMQAHCYIDGELKQSISNEALGYINPKVLSVAHRLGGDYRYGNSYPFKRGYIKDVAIYSDLRTASEIENSAKNGIAVNDDNIIAYYDCTENGSYSNIVDKSENGYDILYSENIMWYTDKPPVTDYAYSFAVVGDTQKLNIKNPDKLDVLYDWIVSNKDSKKIAYVMGVGDITDKNTNAEWTAAKNAIVKMNGQLPYSLIAGNHDTSAKFNEYFGSEAGLLENITGYYKDGKIDNTYNVFKVGNVNYLLLNLQYGANDDILRWAGNVIEQYPLHRVIISTHSYLSKEGDYLNEDNTSTVPTDINDTYNNGDDMWDKLVCRYENIFLVICGHVHQDNILYRQDVGINGNTVTQILVNPQDMDNTVSGGVGMVCMLYFSEDGQTVSTEWYSTVKNQFYKPENQHKISLVGVIDGVISEEPQFRINNGYIQWRNGDLDTWKNIIAISDINGADGINGITPEIKDGVWWIGDYNTGISAVGSKGDVGPKGDTGDGGFKGLTVTAIVLSTVALVTNVSYILIHFFRKKGINISKK